MAGDVLAPIVDWFLIDMSEFLVLFKCSAKVQKFPQIAKGKRNYFGITLNNVVYSCITLFECLKDFRNSVFFITFVLGKQAGISPKDRPDVSNLSFRLFLI